MGTRSLLGYEKGNGQVHVQYLQFDGYPTGKGADFFEFLRKTLCEDKDFFLAKKGDAQFAKTARPNRYFFSAVRDFLNYRRWQTPHSFNNRFTCERKAWDQQDCWQEWQYLVTREGDFQVYRVVQRGAKLLLTIPFALTLAVADSYYEDKDYRKDEKPLWKPFWQAVEDGKPARLELLTGECWAFPGQGPVQGWRDFSALKVTGRVVTHTEKGSRGHKVEAERETMFADIEKRRKVKTLTVEV